MINAGWITFTTTISQLADTLIHSDVVFVIVDQLLDELEHSQHELRFKKLSNNGWPFNGEITRVQP